MANRQDFKRLEDGGKAVCWSTCSRSGTWKKAS